jgi:hypothetical protein
VPELLPTAHPGTAYNINIPGYGKVTTNPTGGTGSSTTVPSTSPTAQFYFYNASNPTSPEPLSPGASTIIKSEETGKFCRLMPTAITARGGPRNSTIQPSVQVSTPPGSMLVMVCDVTNPALATPMTYSSGGLTYYGQPILPVGPGGQMAVLPPGAAIPFVSGSSATSIGPSGPSMKPGLPFNIRSPTGYVSTGPGGEPLFTNTSGKGDTPAEQFTLTPYSSTTSGYITPGSYSFLKSVLTGKFCRLVPGATPGSKVVLCDLDTTAGATPLMYTGTGLTYNGLPLVPGGPGQPLALGTGTSIDPNGNGTSTDFNGPALATPLLAPPPLRRKGCPSPPPKGRKTVCAPPPRLGSSKGKAPPPRPPAAKQGLRQAKPPPPPGTKVKGRRPPPGGAKSQAADQQTPGLSTKAKPPPPRAPRATGGKPPTRRWPSPVVRSGTSSLSRRSPPVPTAATETGPAQPPYTLSVKEAPQSCSVPLNAPCGGISMCGVDGGCEGHCCSAGGTCTRHSAFSWTCQQEQAPGQ